MKLLKGRWGTHRLLIIGLSGEELGGIRNSDMMATLDGVRGAPLQKYDYISIARAETEEDLRKLAEDNDVFIEEQQQPHPGIIEKPKGGLD